MALPTGYEEEADEYASLGYILWYDEENPHYWLTNKYAEEIEIFMDLNEAKEYRANIQNSSTGGRIFNI